jgi:hypothetical protein
VRSSRNPPPGLVSTAGATAALATGRVPAAKSAAAGKAARRTTRKGRRTDGNMAARQSRYFD